jgi:hypothetical protein
LSRPKSEHEPASEKSNELAQLERRLELWLVSAQEGTVETVSNEPNEHAEPVLLLLLRRLLVL